MKTILIIYALGFDYKPITMVFDDHDVCHQVRWSLEVQELNHKRLTPRQLYYRGHGPTVFFISCKEIIGE